MILSSGPGIPFDPDELNKVLEAIQTGSATRLRQGFFNPSFFVSIVEDTDRRGEWFENTRLGTSEEIQERRSRGMQPLKDLFKEPLALANGVKALPGQ